MALAWDDFLTDVRPGNVAGTFEYFDTEAQVVVIRDSDGALVSTYDTVDLGQWLSSSFGNALRIGNFGLDQFVPRHNYNGELWAVGIIPVDVQATTGRFPTPSVPAGFYLFRYTYFQDLSNILDGFDTSEQSENQIKDATFTIKNIGEEALNRTYSMFTAGSKIVCKLGMGDSVKMPISTTFLDEVSWDKSESTMDLSGRNAIGYYLSSQTFDEAITYSGTRTSVVFDILSYSGVDLSKICLEADTTTSNPTFKTTDTLLDGLNYIFDVWGWLMTELPDGRIIIGSPTFHATYYSIVEHVFEKDESFVRGLTQRVDGAYSRLALQSNIPEVPGENPGDPPISEAFTRTVYKDLTYFEGWSIGNRKTLYINLLENQTEEKMITLAEEYAKAYQYIGVNTTRDMSIHPEIQSGDIFVFADADGSEYIQKGIITGVKNVVSVKNGSAHTIISIDSGGTIESGVGVKTYTAYDVTGDTRKRELLDVIRKTALAAAKK